ncbi:Crp/Fnr family transcriptional regulator [Sulfurimonas sp. HSL-1716]|uniref:Crp/Fnr family transcriptional regulator n=1 Tax=Hydrocurvibacter sulfurireducens TaxID=3131937 RepID=UPI0031F9333C
MSILKAIESLDFFAALSSEDIQKLASFSTLHDYNKGYLLYYEKEQSKELLFLTKGLAKAYKIDKHENDIFLYYIHENSLISRISDIKSETILSFSNITLLEDSQILGVDYKRFKEEFLHNNVLCFEFINEMISRSKKLEFLIDREFIFDSVSKVAMMLNTDLDMFNKLKRHEVSLVLHIQPATLSRILNRLKRNKIIDIIHGRVIVLDSSGLEAIYKE